GAGGGIYIAGGAAQVTGSTFSANHATGGPNGANFAFGSGGSGPGVGGGIYDASPGMTITNCTFRGNSATFRRGINSTGTLTVTGSTATANPGGGIQATTATVTGCTVNGNAGGGGISAATLTVSDCTIAGNGNTVIGGIRCSATLSVSGSTVNGNA